MRSRITWVVAAGMFYGLIVLGHARLTELLALLRVTEMAGTPRFKWAYALVYCIFGVLLMGATARLLSAAGPVLWRPTMLVAGALLAALELWLVQRLDGDSMRLETWMAALLGLALAALVARFLPDSLLRRWFGIERRGG